MGKISPISAKYIIHISISARGVVDKPDVIGAIFGQTEGLLGTELELRELQKNGRIGRIEVNLDTKSGKTKGRIMIPSSLDMAETSIVASSLETIQRIGPCDAKLKVKGIEDVRVSKREYVVERAKELLKNMLEKGPESGELMDEIKKSVRALEISEYGPERLSAGPGIKEADELIVVEGRADVIALLRNGFRNVISLNGTSVPKSIAKLTKQKITIVFVDGDRGGDLIVKGLASVGDVDFVAKAPSGKEVEELTKKEINKCLRGKIPLGQFMKELKEREHHGKSSRNSSRNNSRERKRSSNRNSKRGRKGSRRNTSRRRSRSSPRKPRIDSDTKKKFKEMLEELVGTRGAYLLDEELSILGKVPVKEIETTLSNLEGVKAIIMDGVADSKIVRAAESSRVKHIAAMESKSKSRYIGIFTAQDLGL